MQTRSQVAWGCCWFGVADTIYLAIYVPPTGNKIEDCVNTQKMSVFTSGKFKSIQGREELGGILDLNVSGCQILNVGLEGWPGVL